MAIAFSLIFAVFKFGNPISSDRISKTFKNLNIATLLVKPHLDLEPKGNLAIPSALF